MAQQNRLLIQREALVQQQLIGASKDVYSGTYARDLSKPTQVPKTVGPLADFPAVLLVRTRKAEPLRH